MSDKAKKLLKQAVKVYLEEDGATEMGSYRDAITDLLHMAKKNKVVMKDAGDEPYPHLKFELLDSCYDIFLEESESTEYDKVVNIPARELPLHLDDKFFFDSSRKLFDERLKSNS